MSEGHHWNEPVQITIRTASSARGHSRTFRLQKTRPQEWQSAL